MWCGELGRSRRTLVAIETRLNPGNLVVVRQTDLSAIVTVTRVPSPCDEELLTDDPGGAVRWVDEHSLKNVVLDCRNIEICTSTVVAFFLRLWTRTRSRHGRLAICNVSDHLVRTLERLRLAGEWPVFGSLAEALQYVEQ
jgi:hypothetical protein